MRAFDVAVPGALTTIPIAATVFGRARRMPLAD